RTSVMAERRLLLEGLPDDLDAVVPMLELYFKNKRSGGEAVQIQEHPEDRRKALLIYLSEADMQNVLTRVHRLDFRDLGMVELTVKAQQAPDVPAMKVRGATVRQPPEQELLKKVKSSFPTDSSLVLQLAWVSVTTSTMVLYVDPMMHSEEEHDFGFSVEEYKEHLSEKPDPRPFILTGFKDTCNYKLVTLFISSCSKKARHSWEPLDEDRIAVTFKEDIAAYRVVDQRHCLCGEDLAVLLFYTSLQKPLTGETPTLSGVQTNITIPVNMEILNFIENHEQCKNDLQGRLKMVHATVLFDKTTFQRELVVEMDLDKDSLAALRIGPTWRNKARKAAQDFLMKLSVDEVAVEDKVWKSVESKCLQLITPKADIFFRQTDSKIVVVGLAEVVTALVDKIKNLVKEATIQAAVDGKTTAAVVQGNSSEKIPLKSVREMEFIKSYMNLLEISEIRKLGISLGYACDTPSTPSLNVTAAEDKIQDAVRVVKKQVSSIVVEKLTYSKPGESKVLQKNEANVKATAKEWRCRLYFEHPGKAGPPKTFRHLINSSTTLTIAEGDLPQYAADALICPMSTSLAFDNPTAQQFLETGGPQIQEVCNKLQKEKQVLLAGDVVLSNPGNLRTKTLIYAVMPQSQETHNLKSAIVDSLHKAEQRGSASVAMPVLGYETFGFSVRESCTAVREAVLQFSTDHQNGTRNLKTICVIDSDVKVVEEFNMLIAAWADPSCSAKFKGVVHFYVLHVWVTVMVHGVLVSLKKGDITKETVDVIVNSNNRDLNLHTGVSGAIFRAAGESVVNEYIKHVSLVLPGPGPDDVTLTSGGDLPCKHIAQMFGPVNAEGITTSVEGVLKLCDSKKATSVAVPAIGTGGGGISAYEAIRAIFTGLENHLTQQNSSWLRKIVVLAFDQIIWSTFRDYFRERNKSLPATLAAPANQVRIKGVRIEIRKGDITNETVRAIVSTTNRDMDSKKGVSGAVFRAAGPSVEQECRNLSPLQGDMVAVTGGGNLQCDFIIHMMGPHSAAEARSRVKTVLERCEQNNISTVSFPAVGTADTTPTSQQTQHQHPSRHTTPSQQTHRHHPSRHTTNIPADTTPTSQQTQHQHPSRHTTNIPADTTPTSQQTQHQHPSRHNTNIPADTPTPSQQTHHQHPSRHTDTIPADTPTPSQQTHPHHPSRHTDTIPADTPTPSQQTHRHHPSKHIDTIPADTPPTSQQTHHQHPSRHTDTIPADTPTPSQQTHPHHPSRHTDTIPADTPTPSQQTHRHHPSKHIDTIPADTPPTSQQTHHQHPSRHTNTIPADTPTPSQQTHRHHPSRHTHTIPADTPPTSQQTHRHHPSRHTDTIPADTPTPSQQTHRHHPSRHTHTIPADTQTPSQQTHRHHPSRHTDTIPADTPTPSQQTHRHHPSRHTDTIPADTPTPSQQTHRHNPSRHTDTIPADTPTQSQQTHRHHPSRHTDTIPADTPTQSQQTHRHHPSRHTDTIPADTPTQSQQTHRHHPSRHTDTIPADTPTPSQQTHRHNPSRHTDTIPADTPTQSQQTHRHHPSRHTDTILADTRHHPSRHTDTIPADTPTQSQQTHRHHPSRHTDTIPADTPTPSQQTHRHHPSRHTDTIPADTPPTSQQTHRHHPSRHHPSRHTDTIPADTPPTPQQTHRHHPSRHTDTIPADTPPTPQQTHRHHPSRHTDNIPFKAFSRRSYPERLTTVLSDLLDNFPASRGSLEPKTHHELRHCPNRGHTTNIPADTPTPSQQTHRHHPSRHTDTIPADTPTPSQQTHRHHPSRHTPTPSQQTYQHHPTRHTDTIPADTPTPSHQTHRHHPSRHTTTIPADTPTPSQQTHHHHPSRHTDTIPADTPTPSQQTHHHHPSRHTTTIPADTPTPSQQTHHHHPSRHTDTIPADTPTPSQQTHHHHPSRHTHTIPADTPPPSQQTHRHHPSRHTDTIPADTPTPSQQTHPHHPSRHTDTIPADTRHHPSRHTDTIPADTPPTSQQTHRHHPSRHTDTIPADTPPTSQQTHPQLKWVYPLVLSLELRSRCGLQGVEAMTAMLEAFEDHLSQRSATALKLVYVVVDRDEVLQEIQRGLKEWTADAQLEILDPDLKMLFDMCGITEAQLKDKETSKVIYDFIVQNGGVEAVKEELRQNDETIQMMSNLLQKKRKKHRKKILTKADIGTPYNFQQVFLLSFFFHSVHISHVGFDFQVDNLDPELKSLFHMCGISDVQLRDEETVNIICDFIEKRGGVEAVKEQFRREVPRPTQPNEDSAKQPVCLATDTAAVTFPVTTVEVYGTSPADLAKVKKLLDDLISEECTSRDVQSPYLASIQEADKEAIVALSKNNQVQILVASSDKLTVSGKKDDVLDTVLNISTFIQAAKEREALESEKRRLRETLCWEVAKGESWIPLDSSISYQLELAFHKKEESFTYEEDGEVYTVDFKELRRENSRGQSWKIKRTLIGDPDTAIIQPPPTWTKMEGRDLEIIQLAPDSDEYERIGAAFLSSSQHPKVKPVQVVEIRRIQNRGLWQRYSVLKQGVDKKYPNQTNEQFLYHGTTKEICQKINSTGFNRSFCGRNAVAHGEGTYFAKEAWYSCRDLYANPDESGFKYIYRARVVTGSPCKSRRGMKEPDPLDPNNPQAGLYDCAVDNLQNPSIYVVFCDAGAYPEYLIIAKNA
ncbi:hypothetical protein NFI96_026799, partial [Prochilodus magdalenae]